MEQGEKLTEFRGRPLRFVMEMTAFAVFLCLVLSLMVMGRLWLPVFFTGLVLLLPAMALIYIITLLLGSFTLDDAARRIRRTVRFSIPYDRVRELHVAENGSLRVSVRTGRFSKVSLSAVLAIQEKERVMKEFAARFPDAAVRHKSYSNRKALLSVLVLIAIAYPVSVGYVYRGEPQVRAVSNRLDFSSRGLSGSRTYKFMGTSFALPEQYELLTEEEQKMFFRYEDTRVKVVEGIYTATFKDLPVEARALLFYSGIRDSVDLFREIYKERFGLVPLALKSGLLKRTEKAVIYEFDNPVKKGFVIKGTEDGEEFIDALVKDKRSGKEINFIVSGPSAEADKILVIIASEGPG